MTLIRPTAVPVRPLGVLALALAAACGDDRIFVPEPPFASFSPTSAAPFQGDTVRLRVTLTDTRTPATVRFSAVGDVLAVDSTGLVTALAPGAGLVNITVAQRGRTVTAAVPVTVRGVALEPRGGAMVIGGRFTFRVIPVGGEDVYAGPVRWESSDTTVARVLADGTVEGVGLGLARITAVVGRDERVRLATEVAVVCACPLVQSLTVQPQAMTIQPGASEQIVATLTLGRGVPAGTSRELGYVSSDTTVATVGPTGLVTGLRSGSAVVTVFAVAAPSVTQAVAVTVRAPAGG